MSFESFVNQLSSIRNITEMPLDRNSIGGFRQKMEDYAERAADAYLSKGASLNDTIAKFASTDALNDDQIQRVVEQANNSVFCQLYNDQKNESERSVDFPVASVDGVKIAMVTPEQEEEKTAMEKVAGSDLPDYTRPITSEKWNLTVPPERELFQGLSRGIIDKKANLEDQVRKGEDELNSLFSKVAEALVRTELYTEKGVVLELHKDLCKQAGFLSVDQKLLQDAVNSYVEVQKQASILPEDYEVSFPYVDIKEKEEDFSLGEFSKHASTVDSLSMYNLPLSFVVGGSKIQNKSDIIKIAKEIPLSFQKTAKIHEELQDLDATLAELPKKERGDDDAEQSG